jgi:hypothetical protein
MMSARQGSDTSQEQSGTGSQGRPELPDKNIRDYVLSCIVKEIKSLVKACGSDGSDRSASYGITKEVLERYKVGNPWVTRNRLDYFKKQTAETSPTAIVTQPPVATLLPDLSDKSDVSTLTHSESTGSELTTSIETETQTSSSSSKAWHPKGATKEAIMDKK